MNMKIAAEGMPSLPRVHYNTGLLLQKENQPKEAEKFLLRAFELEPSNFDCLYALAFHYIKRQMKAEAESIARRMAAVNLELTRRSKILAAIANMQKTEKTSPH